MRGYWLFTDHVCATCFGRVSVSAAKPRVTMCGNCGAEGTSTGTGPGSVCACRPVVAGRDVGIRCTRNPDPRPERPTLFFAKEIA